MSSEPKLRLLRPESFHTAEAPPQPEAFRRHGDGDGHGPYDDGMQQRVAALEGFASDAKEKLTRIETKLEHLEKEVSTTKWWVAGSTVTIVLTMIAAVLGTGVAIQQMTVATFQAAGAQASPPQPAQPPIIINVPGAPAAAPVAPSATTAPAAKTP
ncbi:hypothetical protein [Curvibacter lanceolatus]|uniref:hypothetical protein n=1 Tax=Curvibacter lanceolatus TaxID=86182 RepID=UPI001FE07FA6|nr:hypothetical protein [Curvibacter lanceolatus]